MLNQSRPLSTHLQSSQAARIKALIDRYRSSTLTEVQARSCEYSRIFSHDAIRPELLERMPALDESEYAKTMGGGAGLPLGMAPAPAADLLGDAMGGGGGGGGAGASSSAAGGDDLVDLLGGLDAAAAAVQESSTSGGGGGGGAIGLDDLLGPGPAAAGGGGGLMDLLGDGGGGATAAVSAGAGAGGFEVSRGRSIHVAKTRSTETSL
jgi:AP-1 complex subunit gamma-1